MDNNQISKDFMLSSNVFYATQSPTTDEYRIERGEKHKRTLEKARNKLLNYRFSVYKKRRFRPLIHETVGTWNPSTGFIDTRPHRFMTVERRDQEGHTFRASTVLQNNASINHLDDYVYVMKT